MRERPELIAEVDGEGMFFERHGCGRTTFASCRYVHGRSSGVFACSPADELVCSRTSLAECQQLCASGVDEVCTSLGAMYLTGDRVPQDRERGLAVLRPACKGGQLVACQRLLDGPDVPPSDKLTANLVVCASTQQHAYPESSCAALLDERYLLSPEAVGQVLQRLCQVRGEHCGEAKDFAAAHPSPP